MTVSRDVIMDLIPLYLAGEARPATRSLVEDYLRGDPDLAARVKNDLSETLGRLVPAPPVPEIELRALRRTRRLLALQRWLFALGIFFALTTFSGEFHFEGARFTGARFLLVDHPALMAASLVLGVAFLVTHAILRGRLRIDRR